MSLLARRNKYPLTFNESLMRSHQSFVRRERCEFRNRSRSAGQSRGLAQRSQRPQCMGLMGIITRLPASIPFEFSASFARKPNAPRGIRWRQPGHMGVNRHPENRLILSGNYHQSGNENCQRAPPHPFETHHRPGERLNGVLPKSLETAACFKRSILTLAR